ncbi:MAG: carboxypeptidase-like regulatory domain-containing protein, partial [Candidatus Norongarragalinales archaeon]
MPLNSDSLSPFNALKNAVASFGVVKAVALLVALIAFAAFLVFLPKTGTINVTVRALDGDALPGVEVTLSSGAGDVMAVEYSDDSGAVLFKNVAPGEY